MKKLVIFLTLLLCVSFLEISAQPQTITWSINNGTSLEIRVNSITVVNSYINAYGSYSTGPAYGVLNVDQGDFIEIIGQSNHHYLYPIITDEYYLPGYSIIEGDEYWYTNEKMYINESFLMYPVNMYVEMRTWGE